jgi:hypothetical protein
MKEFLFVSRGFLSFHIKLHFLRFHNDILVYVRRGGTHLQLQQICKNFYECQRDVKNIVREKLQVHEHRVTYERHNIGALVIIIRGAATGNANIF